MSTLAYDTGGPIPTAADPVNRVPQVTPAFWAIKLMAVTMGETAADFLAVNLGLGLTDTTILMTAVLVAALPGSSGSGATCPMSTGPPWC